MRRREGALTHGQQEQHSPSDYCTNNHSFCPQTVKQPASDDKQATGHGEREARFNSVSRMRGPVSFHPSVYFGRKGRDSLLKWNRQNERINSRINVACPTKDHVQKGNIRRRGAKGTGKGSSSSSSGRRLIPTPSEILGNVLAYFFAPRVVARP